MSITCRLWKAIKKYSLSPEVRDARSHTADWNPSCYCQLFSQILYYYYYFSYRMQSLTTGKCVSYFSTYPSVLLPDSFIGNTTCTVNQEVSVTSVRSFCFSLCCNSAQHPLYPPAGYTLFALFEYLVVFSNMAFHLTAVWDFKSREVMVISSSEEKDFWLETEGLGANCTTIQPPDHDSLDPAEEEDWDGLFHIFPWCRLSRPQWVSNLKSR